MSGDSKAQPVAGLRVVGWMTERAQDTTFPLFHREESEANAWVKFCTVGPSITVRPIYAIDSLDTDPVRDALVDALQKLTESAIQADSCGRISLDFDGADIDSAVRALRAAGVEL